MTPDVPDDHRLVILNRVPDEPGWAPITHMIRLAGELLEAPVVDLATTMPPAEAARALALGRRRASAGPDALMIVSGPTALRFLLGAPGWRTGFRRVAAWVIDSFWVDRLPRLPLGRIFDHLFVCTAADVAEYERRTRVPTTFLPWGSDVLRLGGAPAARDVDLMRVGRQPDPWADDATNAAACAAQGVAYAPGPPLAPDATRQETALMREGFQRARLVLAHTNRVQQTSYTHPDKEYITARWTDALACGCVVAGVPPLGDPAVEACLWPGALLDLGTVDRDAGLERIVAFLRDWEPSVAVHNHRMALGRLDWRWRFATVADWFGAGAPRLRAELAEVSAQAGGAPG